ncbi:MAG: carboxypeptidase regulatory-like domain-containing protein [Gemmatirosa sp.]
MRLRFLFSLALLAHVAAAQAPLPPTRVSSATGATVSGVVHDSLAGAPLAGTRVQLVLATDPIAPARSVVSDSLGRFALDDVPDGHYVLGFLHPVLDALGVEAPVREVRVEGRRSVRADLAIPSAARLRAALCGNRASKDSSAALVGVVRDAGDRAPAGGVQVTAQWSELSFTRGGVERRTPRLDVTTGDNGWFALCGVPGGGTMTLVARRGADTTTDVLELEMPAAGFVRRELYLGPARAAAAGGARVSGTVVAAVGGQPLPNAQVGIVGGPQTRANARGEWVLADAPAGTRMLEVRAVGFYPVRRVADVVAGAPPVHVALSTLKAVLDTVKVMAARRGDRDRRGFAERRRTGAGRYLTAEMIARMQAVVPSDLFRNMTGVVLDGDVIRMRGPSGGCIPAVFLDGRLFDRIGASDIDGWMRPDQIVAIEVYTETSVPPQFRQPPGRANEDAAPCGSILIWTR